MAEYKCINIIIVYGIGGDQRLHLNLNLNDNEELLSAGKGIIGCAKAQRMSRE